MTELDAVYAFIAAFARELGCTPAAYYARQPRSE